MGSLVCGRFLLDFVSRCEYICVLLLKTRFPIILHREARLTREPKGKLKLKVVSDLRTSGLGFLASAHADGVHVLEVLHKRSPCIACGSNCGSRS